MPSTNKPTNYDFEAHRSLGGGVVLSPGCKAFAYSNKHATSYAIRIEATNDTHALCRFVGDNPKVRRRVPLTAISLSPVKAESDEDLLEV